MTNRLRKEEDGNSVWEKKKKPSEKYEAQIFKL
jgi:hypothetical protein